MITHDLSPSSRLEDWKNFRKSLTDDLAEEEILNRLAKYWTTVPVVRFYLDFDNPDTWPTPWELINDGEFCSTGIAYLMFKTLDLAPTEKFKKSEMKLYWIKDLEIEDLCMVLVVNSKYVLNYYYGEVKDWDELQKHCQIICDYLGTNLS